ncbi:MAG: zinc finger domain-containing protein [Methanoregula sp.]|nr:zinc finger domain-containing protein [Methanoregula sp.]
MGKGTVEVHGKMVSCPYCTGNGKDPHHRLTCPVCWGKGQLTVATATEICPQCKGSGTIHGSTLPCIKCAGKGLITAENPPLERQKKDKLAKGIGRLQ